MNAVVIKFAPPEPEPRPPRQRRESGTYTMTDRAVLDYQKRNGSATSRTLTALAERSNYRQKAAMSVAEIMQETGLGQRAIEKAVVALAQEGFCVKVGKLWKYTSPTAPATPAPELLAEKANEKANSRSHTRSLSLPENVVLDEIKMPLKEVEGNRRNLTTNNTSSDPPSPDQMALRVVVDAGLQDLWQDWIRLGKLATVTQRAQIVAWADWVTAGHGELLRSEVKYVIEQGSYSHPFAGLKARMTKAIAALAAGSAAAEAQQRAYGQPQCQPGERRCAPDGQVWTVDYVEYGVVFFAEAHGPLDIRDDFAAKWPLAELVS